MRNIKLNFIEIIFIAVFIFGYLYLIISAIIGVGAIWEMSHETLKCSICNTANVKLEEYCRKCGTFMTDSTTYTNIKK